MWLGALGCDDSDDIHCMSTITVTVLLPDGSVLRAFEGEFTNRAGITRSLFCDVDQSQPQNGRTPCQADGTWTFPSDIPGTDTRALGFQLKIRSLDGQWAFDRDVPSSEFQINPFRNCYHGVASVTVSPVTP